MYSNTWFDDGRNHRPDFYYSREVRQMDECQGAESLFPGVGHLSYLLDGKKYRHGINRSEYWVYRKPGIPYLWVLELVKEKNRRVM